MHNFLYIYLQNEKVEKRCNNQLGTDNIGNKITFTDKNRKKEETNREQIFAVVSLLPILSLPPSQANKPS